MKNYLCIFGFGYTSHYVADICLKAGFDVMGVARYPEKINSIIQMQCQMIHFSKKAFAECGISPTHILISTPPSNMGDPTFNEFCDYLTDISPALQSIVYLSSTGVYGDYQGGWVDESSEPHNPGLKGKWRLSAEKSWMHFADKTGVPLYIFRVASIYGPYRNALQKIKNGQQFSVFKKNQFFSRIHVEDLANIIKAALLQTKYPGIYNICDNEPASNTDVDDFAARLMGLDPLPRQSFEQASLSDAAREFFRSNKRVSHSKVMGALGVSLTYPNYRVGLTSLFKHGKY